MFWCLLASHAPIRLVLSLKLARQLSNSFGVAQGGTSIGNAAKRDLASLLPAGLGDATTVAIIAQVAAPLNAILDLIVAPWFEQALFRGFLQTSLSRLNPLCAIVLSAAYQGTFFMGQHRLCDLQHGMLHPRRLLVRWFAESALAGAVYGLVFQKTRSLLPVVLLQQLETLSKMVRFSYERGPLRVALKMAMWPSTGGQ